MTDSARASAAVEQFVKTLIVTAKAVLLYPPSSNIPLQTAQASAAALAEVNAQQGELVLTVSKDGLECQGCPLKRDIEAYRTFAHEFYLRRLAEIVFNDGTTAKDIVAFLSVLAIAPDDLEAAGGYDRRLWELGVGTITVAVAQASLASSVVDLESEAAEDLTGEAAHDSPEQHGPTDRTQMTLQRFASDHEGVARRLLAGWGTGGQAGLDAVAAAFTEIAQLAASTANEEERAALSEGLGGALEVVDGATRRQILSQRIMAEATTNVAVGDVIRRIGVEGIARLLLRGVGHDEVSRSGVARAVRVMSRITGGSRRDTALVFGDVMCEEGFEASFIAGVVQDTSPTRVLVRPVSRTGPSPVSATVSLLDLVPAGDVLDPAHNAEVRGLLQEVEAGISDGDVVMALISLCFYDTREASFSTTMSVLEDCLDVLLARGEITRAADAVDAIIKLGEYEHLHEAQRTRVRGALARLTKQEDMEAVVSALRHSPKGSAEHAAAQRLLDGLGVYAIDSLVATLAAESDMAMRKALVEILSEIAVGNVEDVGGHVGDSRWYVVRNMVSILGSVKDPRTLQYLRRAQMHPEPRVRREAVRAIGSVGTDEANELLIVSLGDTDGQVAQLAARFLGAARVSSATPALCDVARGQGGGNRDGATRCEAIDALARIGSPEAVPVIQSLTKRRGFGGGSAGRDVRTAAEAALERLAAEGGGL